MSNFKTINENGNLASSQGLLKILSSGDKLMQDVEMWLLNDKKNRNKWTYLNLEQHAPLFAGIPILVAYVNGELGKESGHNFTEVRKPNGEIAASFIGADAEHIVGYIPTKNDVRIEQKDGETWIVANGKIWTWYAQELVGYLKEQGLEGQQISIETLVNEIKKDSVGDEMFPKWTPLGVTVLGTGVQEAVENAYIRALSAIGVDKIREQTRLRVASVYEQEQKQNPQTKTKKENKVTMKIKDLQAKVEGFKVLGVDGSLVALLSQDKGEAFVSAWKKDNGEIIVGAKTAVNASVVFGEGDNEVRVALDSVIDGYVAENSELKTELSKEKENCETITAALNKMQTQETARRKEAVKNAIIAKFNEIKECNDDCDFADDECDELMTDEKLNEYISFEDKDGKFIGEQKACADVSAKCMDKINTQKKLKKNSHNKVFAWDIARQNSQMEKAKDDVNSSIKNILE